MKKTELIKLNVDEVKKRLSKFGFKEVPIPSIKAELKKEKYNIGVDLDSFTVMKRAKGSNFFVFLGQKKDKVILTYYNPVSPLKKDISRENILISETIDRLSINNALSKLIKAMKEKKDDEYFFWPHNHIGFVKSGGRYFRLIDLKPNEIRNANGPIDDGVAKPFEVALYAALYHGDFYALTSHNHFYLPVYKQLKQFANELGIKIVPGTEFTMPPFGYDTYDVMMLKKALRKKGININFKKNWYGAYDYEQVSGVIDKFSDVLKDYDLPMRTINGPHVVVLYKTPEIGWKVQKTILNKRDVLYAPISSVGVQLISTLKELKEKYGDDVYVILAHPFCNLGLPSVGIGNRLEFGELPLGVLNYLIKNNLVQGIAAYNPGIPNEKHLFDKGVEKDNLNGFPKNVKYRIEEWFRLRLRRAKRFKKMMAQLTKEKFGKPSFEANAMNMALGRYLSKVYGTPLFGEPDTHWYGKFDITRPRMNSLGRTVTVVKGLKKADINELFNILYKSVGDKERKNVDYIAYVNVKDGKIIIPKERRSSFNEKIEERYYKEFKSYGLHGFFGVLISDIIRQVKSKVRRHVDMMMGYILRKFIKR